MQETISKPLVSVIIPSYNHEAFIEECIQSVLDQTFQDFEIVITDDGSTDGMVEKIKRFSDPRIRLFEHAKNEGASIAANNCLRHARGEYIAMLSSDDAWLPEKLEIQVDYLQNHPEIYAVFTKINWIDENSELITEPDFYYKDIFNNAENRSRYEWLHLFFFQGEDIGSFEDRLSADHLSRRGGDQAHDRKVRHAFSAPAFADDSQGLSFMQGEGDPIDRLDDAGIGLKICLEVSNV